MAVSKTIKGKTPNGGVRAVVYFQDRHGSAADEADATAGEVLEFDADDQVVARSYGVFGGQEVFREDGTEEELDERAELMAEILSGLETPDPTRNVFYPTGQATGKGGFGAGSPGKKEEGGDDDEEGPAANVFCPTGPGGGVDPSCSPGGSKGGSKGFPPDDQVRGLSKADEARVTAHEKEVFARITPAQREAVDEYTDFAYRPINNYVLASANGENPPPLRPKDQKILDEMDSLLKSAPPFAEPVNVYRGMKLPPEQAKAFMTRMEEASRTGGEVQMPAFTSTSLSPGVAGRFEQLKHGQAAADPITFEISARKGLYLEDFSTTPGENEFLLPRDSRFKVVAVKQVRHQTDRDGERSVRVVQLEQLP